MGNAKRAAAGPKINPEIFRGYDIRGSAELDLTNEACEAIGKAYATFLLQKKPDAGVVAVGRDNRESSARIWKAVVKGITGCGIDVYDIGLSPTPVLYFAIICLRADGGISVTGSHNPVEFNGLKINVGEATLYGEEIQELGRMAERCSESAAEGGNGGKITKRNITETAKGGPEMAGKITKKNILDEYMHAITSRVKLKRKLKVVIDAGNGMASGIAPRLFRALGCEVVPLYCKLDGTFPNHLPDPTRVEFVQGLIARVKEEKADVGLGFDGDVDRVGVIDEKGMIVWADRLMMLFAKEILSRRRGETIIFDVKCSQALDEVIKAEGGVPLMWKTGHSLSKAKLRETGAPISGEMSGHIFFNDRWFGFDDGFYVAARFLEILAGQGKTVSGLMGQFPEYCSTPEIRLDYSDGKKFAFVESVKRHMKKRFKTIDIDGVRVLYPEGWALLRASNTQPKIILRFEAKSGKALEGIKKDFMLALNQLSERMLKL